MDLETEKNNLIDYISKLDDDTLIEQIKQFVKANEMDYWDELTPRQKQEINQGILELENGQNFSLEDVLAKYG